MVTTLKRLLACLWLLPALGLLGGCSPRLMLVRGAAHELAQQGQSPEEDLGLAREASAFYLKLSESLLRQVPDDLPLAEAVAGGYTQYAYAFVAFEADRLEARDAKAAQALRQRAARLYLRAKNHAMTALALQHPGFAQALASPDPAAWPRLSSREVGVAYWAAAAWAAHISLSKDDPDTVADLPLAVRLARLAWERAPEHGAGALASLMGTLEAARPGGNAQQALVYFDRAIALGAGLSAGPWVAKAEGWAQPAGDRAAFDTLLQQALLASERRRDLPNAVMRERAQWLLASADDLF
jgi:hypothetical protein